MSISLNIKKTMIKIFPNFLNELDRKIMVSWALENYEKNFFNIPTMNPKHLETRRTTRATKNNKNNFNYPQNAYDVQNKILDYFQIEGHKYPSGFKDGIVCGVGKNGDSIYRHTDPIYYENTYTIHANFIVQKPESGGITIIEGKEYDINPNDLLIFVPSHLNHEVSESFGNTKRILWCYGFSVDKNIFKNIFS